MAGGTPEAMAIPKHRGKATRNTTTDANRSCFMLSSLNGVDFMGCVLGPNRMGIVKREEAYIG
jgi:hypothetical protein